MEDAKLLTLSANELYEFGDKPYTGRFLAAQRNMFVRVRVTGKKPAAASQISNSEPLDGSPTTATEPPKEMFHLWSRIIDVHITEQPYMWHQKRFDLTLELESRPGVPFPLTVVSHSPPTYEEYEKFRESAPGQGNIPSSKEAEAIRSRWNNEVKFRKLTAGDVDDLMLKNEKLRNVLGNIAVVNAVRDRENMALASAIGLVSEGSDRKERGASGIARSASALSVPQSPLTTGRLSIRSPTQPQAWLDTVVSPQLSIPVTPVPRTASQLSIDALTAQPASPEAELFAKYIQNQERICKQDRLAKLSERNTTANIRSRLAGQADEKKLKRLANFESQGLWLTNDEERRAAADAFEKEKEEKEKGEEKKEEKKDEKKSDPKAAGKEDGKKDDKKGEEKKEEKKPDPKAAAKKAQEEAEKRYFAIVAEACESSRKMTEDLSSSIPDDIFDVLEQRASQLSSDAGAGGGGRSSAEALTPQPSMASPNILRSSSQLLRYSLSIGSKRPREEQDADEA